MSGTWTVPTLATNSALRNPEPEAPAAQILSSTEAPPRNRPENHPYSILKWVWGFRLFDPTTIVYWGFIGIMEKKMETTIVYWDAAFC